MSLLEAFFNNGKLGVRTTNDTPINDVLRQVGWKGRIYANQTSTFANFAPNSAQTLRNLGVTNVDPVMLLVNRAKAQAKATKKTESKEFQKALAQLPRDHTKCTHWNCDEGRVLNGRWRGLQCEYCPIVEGAKEALVQQFQQKKSKPTPVQPAVPRPSPPPAPAPKKVPPLGLSIPVPKTKKSNTTRTDSTRAKTLKVKLNGASLSHIMTFCLEHGCEVSLI